MLDERSLTKGEDKKKEKYVKGMKKSFGDFKARYGEDAKSVMYATATKMAKEQNYDKFDRTVRAASAVSNPKTKVKLLKVAATQRPIVKTAEETQIDEALPLVVSGGIAVGKMAAKTALKGAVRKAAAGATGAAASRVVAGKVAQGAAKAALPNAPVAGTSKVVGKSAGQKASSVVKSNPGMQSKKAPSIPKKVEGGTVAKDEKGMTSNRPGSKSYKPGSDTPDKKPEEKKSKKKEDPSKKGQKRAMIKQKIRSAGSQLQSIFEPTAKESYEQEGESFTFNDFRKIVSICNSDEEVQEVEENIIQRAMDAVDAYNRKNQQTVDAVNKTLGRKSSSMPKHGYFTPQKKTNESAAWTKKAGKNSEGGRNEKGRKSYEKENPGSDLKAPSKEVGNPRRASFCARMKGMKKKLTSKKTASDPDSRINKSLRKWNC